jgi:hypothetical protein
MVNYPRKSGVYAARVRVSLLGERAARVGDGRQEDTEGDALGARGADEEGGMARGGDEPGGADLQARLRQWRREHPQATFDEIEDAVQQEIVALQAQLVEEVLAASPAAADGEPVPAAGPLCAGCGTPMQRSGQRTRTVLSRLGQPIPLERAYYVCPACGAGLFPPG